MRLTRRCLLLWIVACLVLIVHCPSSLALSLNHDPSGATTAQKLGRARRWSIQAMGSAVVNVFWTANLSPQKALAAVPTPTEAIRRTAANIPGYGETDVFYPQIMLGKWRVTREILVPEIGQENNNNNKMYDIRFLSSINDNAVVADRGFNEASLANAADLSSSSSSSNPVRSYEWDQTNPNDLRLVREDGSRQEIKVTKRATERTDETVFSSEFQRVTTEDATRGYIPTVSAQRVLSKYKVVNESVVEGIQIVYDVGTSLGDPLAMVPGMKPSAGPQVVSKTLLHLQRVEQ